MLDQIPASLQYLLDDETRAYAFLATIMPDGEPQLTPVWFNVEDGAIAINTAQGRVKDKNLRRNPQLALVIIDLNKPLEYIQIRGQAVGRTEKGAVEHIHTLAKKYTGADWKIPVGQVRVKYRIEPHSIS